MTTDKKPFMFGPSYKIDTTNNQPRPGKSALHSELMIESLEQQKTVTESIKSNSLMPLGPDISG